MSVDDACALLASGHFYDQLRGVLRQAGLPEAHLRFGVGLYVACLSRFGDQPVRVYVKEATPRDAVRLVRSVGQLIPKADRAGIYREFADAWPGFRRRPESRILFLPAIVGLKGPEFDFDLVDDEIRVHWTFRTNSVDAATGRFVVVTAEKPPYEEAATNRWLTIELPAVDDCERPIPSPLSDTVVAAWHHVQASIGSKYAFGIARPAWRAPLFQEMGRDYRKRRHVHAFSKIWDAVATVRSFQSEESEDVQTDFESYAAAALLFRRSFKEGWAIPSAQKVYDKIVPDGTRSGVLNPANGLGKRYEHVRRVKTRWRDLF